MLFVLYKITHMVDFTTLLLCIIYTIMRMFHIYLHTLLLDTMTLM